MVKSFELKGSIADGYSIEERNWDGYDRASYTLLAPLTLEEVRTLVDAKYFGKSDLRDGEYKCLPDSNMSSKSLIVVKQIDGLKAEKVVITLQANPDLGNKRLSDLELVDPNLKPDDAASPKFISGWYDRYRHHGVKTFDPGMKISKYVPEKKDYSEWPDNPAEAVAF